MGAQQPTAFFSYARWDDEHDNGHLSDFRKQLAEEVQAQTGSEFLIFQDQIDVVWGQDWQRCITDSLNETVFFIPVLTPTFFTRPACRQEASLFLEREKAQGREGLILPVYYISSMLLDDEAERAADPLAQALEARQRVDWRELRRVSFKEEKAKKALVRLAGRLRDALRRYRTSGPVQTTVSEPSVGQTGVTIIPQPDAVREPVKQMIVDAVAQPTIRPARADVSDDLGSVSAPHTDPVGTAGQTLQLSAPTPGGTDSLVSIGVALGQTGDINGAVERFRQAIALDPTNAGVRVDIGIALVQMGDLNGAAGQFSQAISLDPASASAHNGLGMVLARMGNLIGAATQFRQAVAIDPSFGKGCINLGMALGQMGDMNGAFQQFRQAATLPPKDTDALICIGVALGQMGDINGAALQFRQAIALAPNSPPAHNSLGMALWDAGDLNGAAGQFGRAISLDPGFSKARNNLGMVLGQMGDINGAFAQFRQSIAIEMNHPAPSIHPENSV
jgi:Flp pilus assembly protein TadD